MLLALNSSSRTAELDRNCAVSVSAALFCCCWLNCCRVFLSGRSPMERCKDLLYFLLFFLVSLAYQPLRSARERASASALLFQPECFSLNQSESSFVFLPLFFCLLFCYCMHLKFRCGGRGMCPALHISFSLIGYS